MKKLVVASNMYQEIDQLPLWFSFVKQIADGGILIVDSGSIDGTIEYAREQGAIVIINDIIKREGYGPARTHLREETKNHFPDAHWMLFLDADESISEHEFHNLRFIKDYLLFEYDVVVFPRIDWYDREMTKAENDWKISPDWQARMTRLNSPLQYVRKLHEQIIGFSQMYANLTTPKINHFHRCVGERKRNSIGKLCAKLHFEDTEYGNTMLKHHKEDMYFKKYQEEGLD